MRVIDTQSKKDYGDFEEFRAGIGDSGFKCFRNGDKVSYEHSQQQSNKDTIKSGGGEISNEKG